MVKRSQRPIGLKSETETYLGQPIEYSNFEFEVLNIANLESTCLFVILDKIGLNGPNNQ